MTPVRQDLTGDRLLPVGCCKKAMQNHKVGMMNKSIDKKHLNDWLLEAWGNHPIISEQQQENFKQCFHNAKTYSQAGLAS
jgi:hypothetical protein